MTQEQKIAILIDLIKFFSILGGAVWGYIVTVRNLRAHMDRRVSENSAGASKLLELVTRDKEIEDKLDELRDEFREKDESKNNQIKELAKEIRDFTFNALKLFQNSQK
jgi:hypothetical protein